MTSASIYIVYFANFVQGHIVKIKYAKERYEQKLHSMMSHFIQHKVYSITCIF